MSPKIPSVKTHTIEQLFSPFKSLNMRYGAHVVHTNYTEVQVPFFHPFRSNHFSFFLVKKGEITIKLNLTELTIQQSHILMLSPNVVRQFVRMSTDFEVTVVAFTPQYLSNTGIHFKGLDSLEFLSSQVNPLLKAEKQDIKILLKMLDILELKSSIDNDRAYQEEVSLQIFSGFIYEMGSLYKKQEAIESINGTRKEQLLFKFLKMLHQHFKEIRSAKSYAELLHVTPKYLSHTIKEVSGRTPNSYVEEIVTMEAKILLNNLDLAIGEIAFQLNFSDQFFFSKYFKKQSGLTPSQYRQSL